MPILAVVLFLLPGMSSSPISALGTFYTQHRHSSFRKPSQNTPVLGWPCEHSLLDHLVLCSPQSCGFLSPAASQTPRCPVPGPVLATEDKDVEIVSLPSRRASVLRAVTHPRMPSTQRRLGGNSPPTPGLRRRKRDLSWASEDLMVGEQKGHSQQRQGEEKRQCLTK